MVSVVPVACGVECIFPGSRLNSILGAPGEARGYLHGEVSPAEASPLILTETSASAYLCRSFPRDFRELRRQKE